MAVKKLALVLWVLVTAIALFLAIHFAGNASCVFEKLFALGRTHVTTG
jgi:hypothetical protein